MSKKYIFALIAIFVFLISGCSKDQLVAIKGDEVDKIKIKVTNVSKLPEGISYGLILKNTSKYLIKQNSVYISYPIKNSSNRILNKCKVETTGNKLDIKPYEEVVLNAFMSIENFKDNQLVDSEDLDIQIKGYFNEVKDENHFEKSGGYKLFESEFDSNNNLD